MIKIKIQLTDENGKGIKGEYFLKSEVKHDMESILKEIYHCGIEKVVDEDIELGIACRVWERVNKNHT